MEPLEDFDPSVNFDMTGGNDFWFARPQHFFSFPRMISAKDAEEMWQERAQCAGELNF
jgi:hypothetical protein